MGFYPRSQIIDERLPETRQPLRRLEVRRALASLYADKYGIEAFCMRIGNVGRSPRQRRLPLARRGTGAARDDRHRASRIRFEIVYGVSQQRRGTTPNAARLGSSRDDSETLPRKCSQAKPGAPQTEKYGGGMFVISEDGGIRQDDSP